MGYITTGVKVIKYDEESQYEIKKSESIYTSKNSFWLPPLRMENNEDYIFLLPCINNYSKVFGIKTLGTKINSSIGPIPDIHSRLNLKNIFPSKWSSNFVSNYVQNHSLDDIYLRKSSLLSPTIQYAVFKSNFKPSHITKESGTSPIPNTNLCFWSNSPFFPSLFDLLASHLENQQWKFQLPCRPRYRDKKIHNIIKNDKKWQNIKAELFELRWGMRGSSVLVGMQHLKMDSKISWFSIEPLPIQQNYL